MRTATAMVVAGSLVFLAPATPRHRSPLDPVVPNDNRASAGLLRGDTLVLDLEVRMATWRPEADSGPSIDVAAFAEAGKPAQVPAPLIRVREGTTIVATVTNALADSTLSIHGLTTHPGGYGDSLVLRPGESKRVQFDAGAPGTYIYNAVPGKHSRDRAVNNEREQLAGAFVVDPAGGSPPDRIFVINIWGNRVDSAKYALNDYRNALTINGRSWPYTERFQFATGDTVRWRFINASGRIHPMHLHGFYFDVASRGNGFTDTLFSADNRRVAVTEQMVPLSTMAMSFVPDRPGNWLFHCHVGFHVIPWSRLNHEDPSSHDGMATDARRHMAGLTLVFTVGPAPSWRPVARTGVRRLHLFVQEGHRPGHAPHARAFVLQQGTRPPRPDSLELPGSLLVLTRNQPTDIVVRNRLREPVSIHWHGIELESYSDGVSGWSGDSTRMAPSIMPGDSFVAHLTLPRAGTFIYHTHLNDLDQLTSGLYGAIVVLEPGQRFDPRRDHVFVAGWDGPAGDGLGPVIVNGDSAGPPLTVRAGVPQRFRFVNIGVALIVNFALFQDTTLVRWKRLAKDGADLPAVQARVVPARQPVNVGETYDFEFTPEPGEYALVFTAPTGKVFYRQRMVAR